MEGDQVGLTRYVERLRAAALRLAGSSHDAEDLVQDCLASAIQEKDRVRHPELLGAWLQQVLRRRWYDRLRHQAVERRHRSGYRPGSPVAVDESEREIVHRALQSLDPHVRRLLEWRFFDGWSSVEIGREMGKSDGTVRSLLLHALRKFEGEVRRLCPKEIP